ncbi:MAG TPA: 5'/3'-nucleotidase SurE [Myxococcota bacterium]|nr:5'/3'-nucleotidase SurE [Myxococcota bacterium]
MGQSRPCILVSNDDGVQAEGIQSLARHLRDLGDVWVVAPDRERSATSHAISLHKPLRVRQLEAQDFCVDGTPTDCVYLALHHLMPRPPDIVVSGINHGANLGNDVIYSGTVSAAMEGAVFGYRAIAISLTTPDSLTQPGATLRFDTASKVAVDLVRATLDRPMPPGVLLNVNVPNRPTSELLGIKLCRLGFTNWKDNVDARRDPRGRPYYWIGGERLGHDDIPDSDNNAIAAGHVSVTPIHFDVTDYRSFGYVRSLSLSDLAASPDSLGDEPLTHVVRPRHQRERWGR